MALNKSFKLLVPITVVGIILSGCGAHHSKSMKYAQHTATEEVSHKPKHRTKVAKKLDRFKVSKVNRNQNSNRGPENNHDENRQDLDRTPLQSNQQANHNDTQTDQGNNLPTIDLGHGITGIEDRGAGQVYVRFTVNGQQFTTHGNDVNEPANTAVNNAKGIVNNLIDK